MTHGATPNFTSNIQYSMVPKPQSYIIYSIKWGVLSGLTDQECRFLWLTSHEVKGECGDTETR